ncbi:hypothetical protein BDV96DRAFT_647879 [Lophiotrema nucula]|uniref:Kelch repeat protein n=1 Tax=Lophiotrema nucula TaxID=690887 RepID=A0A6A5Z3P5_9PLEO|nr:hypothetical protein BDV96DRAFT_647879 [Lophiotrema nucula]
MLVAFATLLQLSVAQISLTVDTGDLKPLDICGSTSARMTVSNNKVYIYGGTSWIRNDTSLPFAVTNHYLRIADFTSTRDLSDESIMTAEGIPGFVTIFLTGAFWSDEEWLYAVGGQTEGAPYLTEQGQFVPANWTYWSAGTIFKYEIQNGNWSSEPARPPENGEITTGTFCCGNFGWNERLGRGYVFSGSNYPGVTQLDPNAPYYYTGISDPHGTGNMMTFDTATWRWSNKTTDEQLTTTWTESGALVFLPGTETTDGGIAISLGGVGKEPSDNMESMREVLVYDSKTDSWYRQETTAEGNNFPASRDDFCAVAVSASDNSSHNIYIYGGQTLGVDDGFSDMYVLSIPSFHWIPLDVSNSVPHVSGTCAALANRYIVTYGGFGTVNVGNSLKSGCNWDNHGLRLFDMSNLEWTSSYDASKSSYAVPSAVYAVIGGNGDGAATKTTPAAGFQTSDLGTIFAAATGASTTSSSPSSSGSPTNGPAPSSSSSSHTGAIAGGVVGGVAFIAIIAIGSWLLRRRSKRKQAAPLAPAPPFEKHGTPVYNYGHNYAPTPTQELEGRREVHELNAHPVDPQGNSAVNDAQRYH